MTIASIDELDRFDAVDDDLEPERERLPKDLTSWGNRPADRPGERDWMGGALCKDHPEVDFHPDDGEGVLYAQEVCRRCVVRLDCLEYALAHGEDHGVWGGESERSRRRILRARTMGRA